MADHVVAVLHQGVEQIQERTALVAHGLAVGPVLDPPVEREQGRAVAPGLVELVPEVPQGMRRRRRAAGRNAAPARGASPTHWPNDGRASWARTSVEGLRTRRALPDLVEVTGDRRGRGELDQRLEQVERVVVPRAGVLGVVRPVVELGQRQRQPDKVFALVFRRHEEPQSQADLGPRTNMCGPGCVDQFNIRACLKNRLEIPPLG